MKPFHLTFDISDVVKEFSLDTKQVAQISNATSKAVTMEIRRNWIDAAEKALKSTRNAYIRGIVMAEDGENGQTLTLTGRLNNMLENGCSAFDMKEGFMKSAKVKYTKTGKWYMTIPFRFASPDALGESEAFSAKLPREIYDIIKDYQPAQTDFGGNKIGGETLKLGDIPDQFKAPTARNSVINDVINKTFDTYAHKNNIFEGVGKSSKSYQSANQGSYNSFRRVSANSDPMAWIHAGLAARNLSDVAIDNTDVDIIVDNTVDKILSDFGFNSK